MEEVEPIPPGEYDAHFCYRFKDGELYQIGVISKGEHAGKVIFMKKVKKRETEGENGRLEIQDRSSPDDEGSCGC